MTYRRYALLPALVAAASFGVTADTASAQGRSFTQAFAATTATPSGFGLHGGTLGLAFSGSYGPVRFDGQRWDASTVASLGLGDPVNGLGFQIDVNNTSFRNFGASGYLSLTLHHMFQTNPDGVYSVALTASNLAPWGDSAFLDPSISFVGSYMFGIDGRLAIASLGVTTDTNNARDLEVIAGFGVQVANDWSVNAGWVGNQTVLGASWRPDMLGGMTVGLSVRGLEDSDRRMFGVDISRAFDLRL